MSEELSGAEVLRKCSEAYAALSSYSGASAVMAMFNHSGSVHASTASAEIQFWREWGLKLEGRAAGGGGRFTLVSDLERMWRSHEKVDGGAWSESPELGLGGVTGISQGAATTVPAILIRSRWGYPFNRKDPAHLQRHESIGDADCFKVVCETEVGKKTFWIDSTSFLLRQMREEQDEKQAIAMNNRVRELLRERGEEEDVDDVTSIKSTMSLHVFAINSVNEPLGRSPVPQA